MATRLNAKSNEVCMRLHWLFKELDLKQYHLAQVSGVEYTRLNKLLNSKGRPYSDEVISLAQVIGCPMQWLALGGPTEPWMSTLKLKLREERQRTKPRQGPRDVFGRRNLGSKEGGSGIH